MRVGNGAASALALGALACGSKPVCPLPATTTEPQWADANADGQVDVNDGVRITRRALSGGPPPACHGQGDLTGATDVAFEAAGHIWDWLYLGRATAMPAWDGCTTPYPPTAAPECTDTAAVGITAERKQQGAAGSTITFEARGKITSSLDPGPDAWSFGVKSTGCTITAATLAGTGADHTFADPPGVVAEGFAHVAVVDGGAVTAVVPSWLDAVPLPETGKGRDVLALTVSATVPSSGCETCELAIVDDLKGAGQPVAAVIGAGGWTFVPEKGTAEVKVCAD